MMFLITTLFFAMFTLVTILVTTVIVANYIARKRAHSSNALRIKTRSPKRSAFSTAKMVVVTSAILAANRINERL